MKDEERHIQLNKAKWDKFTDSLLKAGLDNFYMSGQWVESSGGLPPAAFSGRNVIQILCKRDKKPFLTTIP